MSRPEKEHEFLVRKQERIKCFSPPPHKDWHVLGSSQTHVWENKSRLFPGHRGTLWLQCCGSSSGPSATWKDKLFERQCCTQTAHHGFNPSRSSVTGKPCWMLDRLP